MASNDIKLPVYSENDDSLASKGLLERDELPTANVAQAKTPAHSMTSAEGVKKIWPGACSPSLATPDALKSKEERTNIER